MLTDQDRQEIAAGKAAYTEAVEAAMADRKLSHEGKRATVGRLFHGERRRVAAIVEAADQRATARRSELERRLFQMPSNADAATVTAYRDALDRCEQINDPTELGRLIDRAMATGDTTLARAGVARSYTKYNANRGQRLPGEAPADQWRDAAKSYLTEAPPAIVESLTELSTIDDHRSNPDLVMRTQIAATVPMPAIFEGVSGEHMVPGGEPAPAA
jgi:hypothetical protein